MKQEDFSKSITGNLVATIREQMAFVPLPLPPEIDSAKILEPVMRACLAIGELKGACRRLQDPYILIKPLQQREALTSSAMEGTYTTSDQLLMLEAGVGIVEEIEATKEVQNYIRALSGAVSDLKTLPISHRMIRQVHRTLLCNLGRSRGANKRPGEYKADQNWIGGMTIESARYVPPPPAEAQTCMDELEAYINREDRTQISAILDLAYVHYQFEAIHPFADGNGRLGRMLTALMTVESGLLELPVLYISASIEDKKDEYIDLMYNVSTKGDWLEWCTFFMERIIESCAETIDTIDELIALQTRYRDLAQSLMRTPNILTLVDHLFTQPFVTVPDVERLLNVTYATAKKTIDKLVDGAILEELGGFHPKVFCALEIWRLVRY